MRALHRVVSALEAEGIEFRPNGVFIERAKPSISSSYQQRGSCGMSFMRQVIDAVGNLDFAGDSLDEFVHAAFAILAAALAKLPETEREAYLAEIERGDLRNLKNEVLELLASWVREPMFVSMLPRVCFDGMKPASVFEIDLHVSVQPCRTIAP